VVDDYFPVKDNRLVFSRTRGNDIWVILLEKAYAKAYGSYESINLVINYII
jgi:calpain-15